MKGMLNVVKAVGLRATMDSKSVPCEMRITGELVDNKGYVYNLYAYGESTYGISSQKVTNNYVDYAKAKCEAWADNGDYASTDLQY